MLIFGQSQFGLNGTDIAINNINLNSGSQKRTVTTGKSGVDSAYVVTGVTDGTENGAEKQVAASTIANVKTVEGNTPVDGVYAWNQATGQKASSSGNIYGIYDLSGGSWERTAGYVANGNSYLKTYGASLAYNGNTLKTASTKYTMVYLHDSSKDNTGINITTANLNIATQSNYEKNTVIYGNAHREILMERNSEPILWYDDYSRFPALYVPFLVRGGCFVNTNVSGLFAFGRYYGYGYFVHNFRAVLVAK